MYKCDDCRYETNRQSNLTRHIEKVHLKRFKCRFCRAKFVSKDEVLLHEKTKHQNLHCSVCPFKTKFKKRLDEHYEKKHRPTISQKRKHEANEEVPKKKIKKNVSASIKAQPQTRFKNLLFHQSYKPNSKDDLLKTQFNYKDHIKSELQNQLSKFGQLKFFILFMITFYKLKDDELVYAYQHFNAGTQTVLHEGEVEEKIDLSMQQISGRVEEFLQLGSGWVYEETSKIDLSVFKYKPKRD